MEQIFNTLYAVDLSNKKSIVQRKKIALTYISWSDALASLMKIYPEATYGVVEYDGKPYLYDENLGYMVKTWMEINGIRREMWLPVMNNDNQAMLTHPYKKTFKNGTEITVEAATMFDINTTIMRCLVKNMAAFGLGLYIYSGDDLPEPVTIAEENKEKVRIQKELQKLGTNLDTMAEYYEVDNILLLPLNTLRRALSLKQAQATKNKEDNSAKKEEPEEVKETANKMPESYYKAIEDYMKGNMITDTEKEKLEQW